MENEQYLRNFAEACKVYLANNYMAFRTDKACLLDSLRYGAWNFGAGIREDGTEDSCISRSYSEGLVPALLHVSLGVVVDSQTWESWVRERLGRAYIKQT